MADEPVAVLEGPIKLPPDVNIQRVNKALSQTIDWSHGYFGLTPEFYHVDCSQISICSMDTGCDPNHPDIELAGNLDFTGSDPGDAQSHGTWVLSYMGAVANDIGVRGIAAGAKMHNSKVLGNDGSGYNQWIHDALEASIDLKHDFLNWSWGGGGPDEKMRRLAVAFINQGGYIFAAAGNSSRRGHIADEDFPAKYPEIPGVAAIGKDGLLTDFSSYGPGVVCCAPGYQMLACIPGGYGLMSGTSMATPCVVGIAAVILAEMLNRGMKRPTLGELVALIQDTAQVANNLRIINPLSLLKQIAKTPPAPPVNEPPTGKITFGPLPIPMLGYAVSLVLDPLTGDASDPVMAEAAIAGMKKLLEQASAP